MRIWVRTGMKIIVSLGFSRASKNAPGIAGTAMLYGYNFPISGQTDSREYDPYKEKTSLSGVLASISEFVCVTALGREVQSPCQVREY